MKWDAVEREFMIVSSQLRRLADSFQALASELHREREYVTDGLYERHAQDESNTKKGPPVEPGDLPF